MANSFRKMFAANCLILVPPVKAGHSRHWVSKYHCLWKGPQCLRRYPALRNVYPGLRKLFEVVLEIPNMAAQHLVMEAKLLESVDDMSHITAVLQEANDYLEKNEKSQTMTELIPVKCFPIKALPALPGDGKGREYDRLDSSNSPDPWFIADRPHLYESFRGLAPLMAVSVEDAEGLSELVGVLNLGRLKLSKRVKSIPTTQGIVTADPGLTTSLRSKADFIIR